MFKTKAGFKGGFFSKQTDKPVHHGWIWAWDGANQWGQHAGAERNGRFQIWLPNGTYDVYASGDGYEEELVASSVVLNDEVVEYTIYLEGEGPKLSLDDPSTMPMTFALHQNYPNPFNPTTTISYDLPEQSHITLDIYDLLGKRIKTLVHQSQDAGRQIVMWDGTDDVRRQVSAGVYLYRIQTGEFTQTRKMLILK